MLGGLDRLCWWCRSTCRLCWWWSSNQLKILHRSNSDPPSKIQTPALQLLVPPRRLISKNQRPIFSPLFFIVGPNNIRKSWAAKFSWSVDWFWKWDTSKWVLEGAVDKLRLTRNCTTWLEGRSWDRVHGAVHPAWAPRAEHVQLIGDLGYVVASCGDFRGYLFGEPTASSARWRKRGVVWRLRIINYEFCTEEIRPVFSKRCQSLNSDNKK